MGTLPTCKCLVGLLLWHLRQFGGKVLERGLRSATQEAPCPQKATYQSPSRCQIGPRSWASSASLNKCSQRCLSAEGQAKQGPVGRVGKSRHSPQSRRCPTPRAGRKTRTIRAEHSMPTYTGCPTGCPRMELVKD